MSPSRCSYCWPCGPPRGWHTSAPRFPLPAPTTTSQSDQMESCHRSASQRPSRRSYPPACPLSWPWHRSGHQSAWSKDPACSVRLHFPLWSPTGVRSPGQPAPQATFFAPSCWPAPSPAGRPHPDSPDSSYRRRSSYSLQKPYRSPGNHNL